MHIGVTVNHEPKSEQVATVKEITVPLTEGGRLHVASHEFTVVVEGVEAIITVAIGRHESASRTAR